MHNWTWSFKILYICTYTEAIWFHFSSLPLTTLQLPSYGPSGFALSLVQQIQGMFSVLQDPIEFVGSICDAMCMLK
jgi:hypothetical protein